MTVQRYSEEFKDSIVTKVFNRGSQSIAEVCKREGISKSAVWSWQQKRDNGLGMKNKASFERWTAEEKLNAIVQNKNLNEEELGVFLRKEGLHSHQIDEWCAEVLRALGPIGRKQNGVKDDRDQRIRELEKDLHRKDKALAEASALLILQKKVNLIWGKESGGEK